MKFPALRQLLSDIVFTAKRDNKWWLFPLIFLLVGVSGLLILGTLAGPIAPFIYPLF